MFAVDAEAVIARQRQSMTELDGPSGWIPRCARLPPPERPFPGSDQLMREPFNGAPGRAPKHDAAPASRSARTTWRDRQFRSGNIAAEPSPPPAVVYCHAGGFTLGNLDTDHRQCVELARRGRCTVVSVDSGWTRSTLIRPRSTTRARCCDGWPATRRELDVDAARLAVAGSGAGGTLAASLAEHGVAAATGNFQLLRQPVLDDRATASKAEFGLSPALDGEG